MTNRDDLLAQTNIYLNDFDLIVIDILYSYTNRECTMFRVLADWADGILTVHTGRDGKDYLVIFDGTLNVAVDTKGHLVTDSDTLDKLFY